MRRSVTVTIRLRQRDGQTKLDHAREKLVSADGNSASAFRGKWRKIKSETAAFPDAGFPRAPSRPPTAPERYREA